MWVTKLLISQVKKRIFCPKTTKFGPKLAFLVNLGQAMQAFSVPCWWVVWWLWREGFISQDTYLLYHIILRLFSVLHPPGMNDHNARAKRHLFDGHDIDQFLNFQR